MSPGSRRLETLLNAQFVHRLPGFRISPRELAQGKPARTQCREARVFWIYQPQCFYDLCLVHTGFAVECLGTLYHPYE
jgi:hypothetical protein